MSPTHVHFNGSVNLPDTESVMREIVARVPAGLRRIPDGETGDRANWIFYQARRFLEAPWLVTERPVEVEAGEYDAMPQLQLVDGVDPATVTWPSGPARPGVPGTPRRCLYRAGPAATGPPAEAAAPARRKRRPDSPDVPVRRCHASTHQSDRPR
jgi:hypothetical protein